MKEFIIYSVPEFKNSIVLISVIGNKSFRKNFKIFILDVQVFKFFAF